MADNPTTPLDDSLPNKPLPADVVKRLGEDSDVIQGVMPIDSPFNDIITEFAIFYEGTMYGLAFTPATSDWECIIEREYDAVGDETTHEVMETLEAWRKQHTVGWLAENGLIPTTTVDPSHLE